MSCKLPNSTPIELSDTRRAHAFQEALRSGSRLEVVRVHDLPIRRGAAVNKAVIRFVADNDDCADDRSAVIDHV